MSVEVLAISSAKWLWDKYGKELTDKATNRIQQKWQEFKWPEAEEKYRTRLREIYSTTYVLGNPKPINLDEIFTDVCVLDKPTAFRRYDLSDLQSKPFDRDSFRLEEKRKPALRLALKKKRLFILGRPGAGKTTFLKYLLLKAVEGKITRTPIFVSLKEWADSRLEILPFIVQQFEICAFPDALLFALNLFEKGGALVLFDGLDEVNQENNQRAQMINTLANFAKRYPDIQICLTCRIAATDYSFDQFTYLEIADFDERQQNVFVSKWYHEDRAKLERFQDEFKRPEQKGLRELARTPLLLALLCLAFDETLSFPLRRADLYKEALDALLKKWDSSRGIKRDEIYQKLSPMRKEQMLARIAAQNFENKNYFVRREVLAEQISQYLQQLPRTDVNSKVPIDVDGESILAAIEAQHGILVERAYGIYSFSHLTFQEYFTARYIVENAASGTIERLARNHCTDDQWREVFLLTASLLDNADSLFVICQSVLDSFLNESRPCLELVNRAYVLSTNRGQSRVDQRASAIMTALAIDFADELDFTIETNSSSSKRGKNTKMINAGPKNRTTFGFGFSEGFGGDLDLTKYFVEGLTNYAPSATGPRIPLPLAVQAVSITVRKFAKFLGFELDDDEAKPRTKLDKVQLRLLDKYVTVTYLMVKCLELAAVTNRNEIESHFLSPPI
jgi:hypothetical protein